MAKTQSCSHDLQLSDGSLIPLNKEKLLVGSSSKCDIQLTDSSVSSYHAMIFADEKGIVTVMDLASVNGVFVGGEKVSGQRFVGEGDTITFGKIHIVLSAGQSQEAFVQEDSEVTRLETQEERIAVPERTADDQVLIDDEYCDIVFDENSFTPIFKSPLRSISFEDYIEQDELQDPFELSKENGESCLMVTTLVSGNILEQTFLPLADGEYLASGSKSGGKHLLIDILGAKEESSFLSISSGAIKVHSLEGFEQNKDQIENHSKDVVVLTRSTFQIFIEISKAPKEFIQAPLFARDKEFWKHAGKTFASVMLPMLLLLLVNFEIEKEKEPKKLSIIYKKPTNTQMNNKAHASKDASKTDKNNGHKKREQNDKKVARSKSGQRQKTPQKSVKTAQAKPKAAAPKTEKSKAPVKAYQFKMASNITSMMADGKTAKVAKTRSPASVDSSSAFSGSLDTKVSASNNSNVGNMGSDLSGTAQSFGAKGLSGKKGMDTSYIETETVVLGSMDPELLRKILQQYLPQFRHCYQQELSYNSEDIQGVVDLKFEISGAGKVGKIDIRAKDSRFSNRGIDCMSKVLSIIDFPKPKGGGRVAVRQPLNFFSEKERS